MAFRRCPDCFEPVPERVKICPNCKSYQDWRRYAGFGQITLALVTALISVTTVAFTVAPPLFQARSADVRVMLEYVTADNKISVLARNEGRSGGVVTIGSLMITLSDQMSRAVLWTDHSGYYIKSGEETRLTVNLSLERSDFCADLQEDAEGKNIFDAQALDTYTESLKCEIVVTQRSFNSAPKVTSIPLGCFIGQVTQCVQGPKALRRLR